MDGANTDPYTIGESASPTYMYLAAHHNSDTSNENVRYFMIKSFNQDNVKMAQTDV
jgi:hypothetical protein